MRNFFIFAVLCAAMMLFSCEGEHRRAAEEAAEEPTLTLYWRGGQPEIGYSGRFQEALDYRRNVSAVVSPQGDTLTLLELPDGWDKEPTLQVYGDWHVSASAAEELLVAATPPQLLAEYKAAVRERDSLGAVFDHVWQPMLDAHRKGANSMLQVLEEQAKTLPFDQLAENYRQQELYREQNYHELAGQEVDKIHPTLRKQCKASEAKVQNLAEKLEKFEVILTFVEEKEE